MGNYNTNNILNPAGAKSLAINANGDRGVVVAHPTIFPRVGVSPSSDTAAINAALLGGDVHVIIKGSATINAPLLVYSNTKLELYPGASVSYDVLARGELLSNYSASHPQRSIGANGTTAGCSMVAGSNILATTDGSFSPDDVGRSITVQDAGPQFATHILTGRVTSYIDTNHVVLDVAAVASVSFVRALVFNVDRNIEVVGGVWTRDNAGAIGTFQGRYFDSIDAGHIFASLHQMNFIHCDNVSVHALRQSATIGKYGVRFGDSFNPSAYNLSFDNVADGVHLDGKVYGAYIGRIRGTTGDDSVAITCLDAYQTDVEGDIENVIIEDVKTTAETNQVKVVGGYDRKLRDIVIRDIRGISEGCAISVQDDLAYCGTTDIDGLVIENVCSSVSGNVQVLVSASYGKNAKISNIHGKDSTAPYQAMVSIGGSWKKVTVDGVDRGSDSTITTVNNVSVSQGASVDALVISNLYAEYPTGKVGSLFVSNGAIGHLFGSDWGSKSADTGSGKGIVLLFSQYSSIGSYTLNNVSVLKGEALLSTAYGDNAPIVGPGIINGLSIDSSYTIINAAVNLDVTLNGLYSNNLGLHRPISINQGASVKLRGSGLSEGAVSPWWAGYYINSGTFKNYNRDWHGTKPTATGGTGPSVTGGSHSGVVTPGTGSPTVVTVTYISPYDAAPMCTISPKTAQNLYISDTSAGSFSVRDLSGGAVGAFTYTVSTYGD